MQFSAPVILASCVEGVWSSLKTSSTDKQHLVEALWLNCGVSGMKVKNSVVLVLGCVLLGVHIPC